MYRWYYDKYFRGKTDTVFHEPAAAPTQGDECECRFCRGTEPDAGGCARGMQPNFDRPEPAEFVASDEFEILEQYALGWTHGWDDHEASTWPRARRIDEEPENSSGQFLRGFLIGTAMTLAVGLFVLGCPAQSPPPPPITAGVGPFQMGYIVDSARVELEQAWDTRNPRQVERGYCIEPGDVKTDTAMDHSVVAWAVHHVHPPETVEHATPYSITFHCSDSAIASIHIHTPSTCRNNVCVLGGIDGAVCTVDEQDRMSAKHEWFTAIQCDKHAFVFYWPGKRG